MVGLWVFGVDASMVVDYVQWCLMDYIGEKVIE